MPWNPAHEWARRLLGTPRMPEPELTLADWERATVNRLTELLSHGDLERLLGQPLIYALREARKRRTGVGTRTAIDLATGLILRHSRDLLADADVRRVVAKRAGIPCPARWHPGKSTAQQFVTDANLPRELAGVPCEDRPPDIEFLEGRFELKPLEDFQLEVRNELLSAFGTYGGRAMMTLPTGAGKTRVAVEAIREWLSAGANGGTAGVQQAVLWLAHTEELCEQAHSCLKQVWENSTACPMLLVRFWGRFTVEASRHRERLADIECRPSVLISTPQRVVNLLEADSQDSSDLADRLRRAIRLIVVDEAHRAAAPSYRRIIGSFANNGGGACVVGLTATPFRHILGAELGDMELEESTRDLREIFGRLIEPYDKLHEFPSTPDRVREKLQARGVLARPKVMEIATGVSLKGPSARDPHNLSDDEVEQIDHAYKEAADRTERRLKVLDEILSVVADPENSTLYFGPTVRDAEVMAFLLRERGVASAFVSGETREATRRQVIRDFRDGRIRVLCNCEVLTTGFDAPLVTHVVVARPTVSRVLYEQMVGRGLRGPRFGGTAECIVVHCDDVRSPGSPELGYEWFRKLWKPGHQAKRYRPPNPPRPTRRISSTPASPSEAR